MKETEQGKAKQVITASQPLQIDEGFDWFLSALSAEEGAQGPSRNNKVLQEPKIPPRNPSLTQHST